MVFTSWWIGLKGKFSDVAVPPAEFPAHRVRVNADYSHRARVNDDYAHRTKANTEYAHRARVNTV